MKGEPEPQVVSPISVESKVRVRVSSAETAVSMPMPPVKVAVLPMPTASGVPVSPSKIQEVEAVVAQPQLDSEASQTRSLPQ